MTTLQNDPPMTAYSYIPNCLICGEPLNLRETGGRHHPSLMFTCPVDSRHFRAFVNHRPYVEAVIGGSFWSLFPKVRWRNFFPARWFGSRSSPRLVKKIWRSTSTIVFKIMMRVWSTLYSS